MTTIFNSISVLSSLVFGVGILYWVMDVTVGKLKFLNSDRQWNGLQYKDAAFLLIACTILLSTTTFYKPY